MSITAADVTDAELDAICDTVYDSSLPEDITVDGVEVFSSEFYQTAKEYYKESGLVRLQFEDLSQPFELLEQVARGFGFDSAFVPPQYSDSDGLHNDFGINEISHDGGSESDHEGFLSNEEQSVHVDGTLEPIGSVPTTIMLCQSQAQSGGESRVFNSVGAFTQLVEEHPELANALCSTKTLTRSDVDRSGNSKTGPVFDINESGLVTRFSLDNTSEWNLDEVEHLQEALDWMENRLSLDSDFYTEFRLAPGDMLIVANHKISHGRNGYKDTEGNRRQLYRALFQEPL
ncbi:TauD/TfdA family dioxygenase [Halosimplex halophilum]|uniref:TauD/TfdA family dioxygenase n=1 Tax=Halosimplex halophilum TaxID=2559572 RepID=UPI00107F385E|nr:TauD/TfdA family dioxygenase [Halosimplex halophilum]